MPSPLSVVIHGHFYQPPREDPWLETVEAEPSAAPAHDWNARIEQECYRAVAAARIPGREGRIGASSTPSNGSASTSGRRCWSGWSTRRRTPTPRCSRPIATACSGWGTAMRSRCRITTRSCRSAPCGRKDHGGALGHRRFPPPVRPRAGRHVAARDRGGRGDARRTRRRGHPLHHPGTAPGRRPSAARTSRPVPDPSGESIVLCIYDGGMSHDVAFGPLVRDADLWVRRVLASRKRGRGW